jgi:hypothetical protein
LQLQLLLCHASTVLTNAVLASSVGRKERRKRISASTALEQAVRQGTRWPSNALLKSH